ncbi:MAG: LysE family transporter [Actinomycetota bacterium]|nr:LysE family transporter [Actinomycetota bacterium]
METYFAGMLVGLAMIIPIGPQNIFLINQGFAVGMPRALVAVTAAGVCDTILISLGGAGTAAAMNSVPWLKKFLLLGGALFLTYLAAQSFRTEVVKLENQGNGGIRWTKVIAQCASVSVLNPHAVLDVVGVLGVAIASQSPEHRSVFAAGTVSASWVWFLVLALSASLLRRWLTPRLRQKIAWVSGAVMLVFAVGFVVEAARG